MKIFDNFRQKLDLVREIRKFRHLRYGQSDFRQPANELVQMGRRNPASTVRDEFLQFHVHWSEEATIIRAHKESSEMTPRLARFPGKLYSLPPKGSVIGSVIKRDCGPAFLRGF